MSADSEFILHFLEKCWKIVFFKKKQIQLTDIQL